MVDERIEPVLRAHLTMSRRGLLVLLIAILLPWTLVTYLVTRYQPPVPGSGSKPVAATRVVGSPALRDSVVRLQPCRPGPWGKLDMVRINLEPPEEFIPKGWEEPRTTTWHFVGMDASSVAGVFDSAGLDDSMKATLQNRSHWSATAAGIDVTPPDEVLTTMPPAPRERIYAVLAKFPENLTQSTPYCFKPDLIDERFANSTLSPERIAFLRRMMYPRGTLLLFSDMFAALNATTNRSEKIEMIKTISRMRTMILRLHLDETSDVNAMVEYWGKGGRAKDLRPLLESLARVPEGCPIDIVHLLPRFARLRLYTFPLPSDTEASTHQDCHWSSFNFFSEPPNPDYGRTDLVVQMLERDYFKLPGAPSFGDIVFFTLPSGDVIHSAVYLADDIVFTKNGPTSEQPWMLMSIADLMAVYTATRSPNEPLAVVYWRRKDM